MARIIASWFGTGLILRSLRGSDLGSGTVAAAFAYPVAVWTGRFGVVAQIGALLVVLVLAFWSISRLAFEGDAGWIVIDEAAGAFLAVVGLGWGPALLGLVVFRAADIFKRAFPGVLQTERLPGAVGVIGDDLVAGAYGLAAGLIANSWLF